MSGDSDVTIHEVSLASLQGLPPGQPAGRAVDVHFDQSGPSHPLTLTFPLQQLSAGLVPVVLHQNQDGRFAIEPGEVSSDGQSIVVAATRFSIRIPWQLDPRNWVAGAIDGVADYITGRTDPPGCGSAPTWVSFQPSDAGTIHQCAQANGDRAELLVKSNRGAFLVVSIPANHAYLWVDDQPDWLRRMLAGAAGVDWTTNIVLPPGGTMSVGFDRPGAGRTIEFTAYTTPGTIYMDGLGYFVNLLLGDFENLKGAPKAIARFLPVAAGVYQCIAKLAGIDLGNAEFVPRLKGVVHIMRTALIDCAFGILANLADPAKSVGAVYDVFGSSLINLDTASQTAIANQFAENIQAVGAGLRRILAALDVAQAVSSTVDKFVDNALPPALATMALGGLPKPDLPAECTVDRLYSDLHGNALPSIMKDRPSATCVGNYGEVSYEDGIEIAIWKGSSWQLVASCEPPYSPDCIPVEHRAAVVAAFPVPFQVPSATAPPATRTPAPEQEPEQCLTTGRQPPLLLAALKGASIGCGVMQEVYELYRNAPKQGSAGVATVTRAGEAWGCASSSGDDFQKTGIAGSCTRRSDEVGFTQRRL